MSIKKQAGFGCLDDSQVRTFESIKTRILYVQQLYTCTIHHSIESEKGFKKYNLLFAFHSTENPIWTITSRNRIQWTMALDSQDSSSISTGDLHFVRTSHNSNWCVLWTWLSVPVIWCEGCFPNNKSRPSLENITRRGTEKNGDGDYG
jgi:hypothetical protein